MGLLIKKTLLASEQERADVKAARRLWRDHRQPFMRRQPERLVFIDETSVKTNMTPLRGRSLKGERLMADAPFGKWQTQTLVAGLRCYELVAPWIIEGAMDGRTFDTYVRTQLAPSLERGDVVVLDNLNVHKSPRAAQALAERGAWFLFLPKYSPDLNPIEMAFAKLKTLLRKAKARTYDALWRAVGDICGLFEPEECWNYLKDAGYVAG
jgi:transposase